MNRDDLLKMLDLHGKALEPPEPADPLAAGPAEEDREPPSPTALELDDWALRKGRELLKESPRLGELGIDEDACADFHAAAFLPDPRLLDDCVDPLRREFLAQLFETPGYHSLHADTVLQEAASAVAACSFASQFAELRDRQKEKEGCDEPSPASPAHSEAVNAEREMAALRAAGKALAEAEKGVAELHESCAAMGMGPGSPGSNDPRSIAALYRRVRSSPTLRRICELAGRYRRVAQSKQRQKATPGVDDVVGVNLAGEVSRLLPVELARLALPELELDTLLRLAERRCMARDHRSMEPVAKGPVIVSVDESGSMQGEKAHTAKALALAMAWVARRQRRWCALVAYSGDSGERLLALPPGRWDENALMDWLEAFIGEGSSLDVPVREMPRMYSQLKAPAGKTDLLFLTDALCRIPADVQARFLEWKRQARARLTTLVIASSPGDLSAVSDEVHSVPSLAVTEEAVEKALSL